MILATDAALVNAIANEPDVKAPMLLGAVYPDGPLDFGEFIEQDRNIVLIEGGFVSMWQWTSPNVYECHVMALDGYRGAFAMRAGNLMLEHMRQIGARQVWGQPSIYNRAALCYVRRMGMVSVGFGSHPIAGDVQYFVKDL